MSLGDVAELDVDRVAVEAGRSYRLAGVLNEGKGLFDRGLLTETNYSHLHRLHRDQLVMRKLTAFEGAIGVVPPDLDGYFVSTEFPTFRLDAGRLLPEYTSLVCQTPTFWQEMWLRSTGTVQRRKRLSPKALLSIPIHLPPLPEQKRIVNLVAAAEASTRAADRLTDAAAGAGHAVFGEMLRFPDPGGSRTTLGEAVELTMGRQRSPKHQGGEHCVPYLRAANVKDGALQLDDVLTMNFTPEEQSKFSLVPGDVLVTEGCGSLKQLGASAAWHGQIDGTVCFQNTLLRLRARPGVTLPEFVELWARYAHASGIWADTASGTNIFHIGSQRAARIPLFLPSVDRQQEIVNVVSAMGEVRNRAQHLATASRNAHRTLLSDLLNGRHEIPESYDELLEAV